MDVGYMAVGWTFLLGMPNLFSLLQIAAEWQTGEMVSDMKAVIELYLAEPFRAAVTLCLWQVSVASRF